MDKHLTGDILSDYAEGLLDGPARATADAHLHSCAECRRELAVVSAYFKEMSGLEPARAPADFLAKVRARLPQEPTWRRALAAALRPLRVIPVQLALATLLGVTAVTVYVQQGGPDAGMRSEIPAAQPASPAAAPSPVPTVAAGPEPGTEPSVATNIEAAAEPAKQAAEQPAEAGYLRDEKRQTLAKSKSARRARSDQEQGDDLAVGSLGGKGSASASGSAVAKPGSMASGSGAEFRGPAPAAAPLATATSPSAPPAPKPVAKTLADAPAAPADKESEAKPVAPVKPAKLAMPKRPAPAESPAPALSRQELDAISFAPSRAVSREAESEEATSLDMNETPARAPVAGLSAKDARPRSAAKEPPSPKAEAASKADGAANADIMRDDRGTGSLYAPERDESIRSGGRDAEKKRAAPASAPVPTSRPESAPAKANAAVPAAYTLRLKPAADTAALFNGLRAMGVKVEAERGDPAAFILEAPAGMEKEIVPYLTRYGSAQVNGIGSRIRLRLIAP